MKNDCELVAMKNKIKFQWNIKFPINSLYLMRGYLVVDNKFKKKYFEICFEAYWRDNIDISNEENVIKILEKSGIKKNEFLMFRSTLCSFQLIFAPGGIIRRPLRSSACEN